MKVLRLLAAIFLFCPWVGVAYGFVVVPPTAGTSRANSRSRSPLPTLLLLSSSDEQQSSLSSVVNDGDDNGNDSLFSSARKARIVLPLQLLTTSFAAAGVTTLSAPLPAHAGVGSIVPFDETRNKKFRGSIGNSVVALRLKSTLRKRGYYSNKAVVATFKSQDDLGLLLSGEFGDGQVVSSSSLEDCIQKLEGKQKLLILYGQDVTISPEGQVSDIQGNDFKSSEKSLLESALKTGGGLDNNVEITLVGGIVIHRTKSGPRKDTGEDCFYPVAMKSIDSKSGVVTDLFGEVFGDLPTPRQSVVLRG